MKLGPYELGPNDTPENGIYIGDARLLGQEVPAGEVDLIFTDPPYDFNHIYLYEWLGKFAARVLFSEGFLLTYVGNATKDAAMAAMRPHLDYFWDFQENMGGRATMVWDRLVVAKSKSILAYRLKGSRAKPRTAVLGSINGIGKEKDGHPWQQNVETARYLIDCFVGPDAVVLDPFVGYASTIKACQIVENLWLAFEHDMVTVLEARQRLAPPASAGRRSER